MASDAEVCSNALVLLTDNPISDFEDGTAGPICNVIFPLVKKRVLTSFPWRFNQKKSELLNRSVLEPPTQYQFVYEFPPDMLARLPRTVWNSPFNQGRSTPFTDFNIFEDGLYTSSEQILIDYAIDKDTSTFPPHVEQLYVYAMAAELAMPIREEQTVATAWQAKAWGTPSEKGKGGYFREAGRIDSQGHPGQSILNYPLITVRHGGI